MNTEISADNFSYMQKFLGETSGYHLNDNKKYLLESRLKLVSELHKIDDYERIINAVRMNPNSVIAKDVIEKMTVNETFFFRDETPFKVFKDSVIPFLREQAETGADLKIWSAACSAGQEPYSIAMILDQDARGLNCQIHASDINKTVVNKAREGVYSHHEVTRGLKEEYRKKYFMDLGDNKWKIQDTLRQKIEYFEQNLTDSIDNFKGPYDVVFLRNVLIYFDQELKAKVLNKIAKAMKPNGFLFLGTSENIYNPESEFVRASELTGVYRKKP